MTSSPPRLRIVAGRIAERPWPLRLPFHYGDVTLSEARELHLRLELLVEDGAPISGVSAEVAAPKWFEKRPDVTPEASADRLRLVADRALSAALSIATQPCTVAELERLLRQELARDPALRAVGACALERSFGVALVERAAIDGLCRSLGRPFDAVIRSDAIGLGEALEAERRRAWSEWRAAAQPTPASVAIRHTVGLSDALGSGPCVAGRPVGLADVITIDRVSRFKVKLPAAPDAAVERLTAVARVLDERPARYRVTLDANEAFASVEPFSETMARIAAEPRLARFAASVAYVEQPLRRDLALTVAIPPNALGCPLIIDESDDDGSSFERSLARGYSGTSLKTCKGILHGLANMALAHSRDAFVTLEDLCVQPGVALQQNLALAALLGVPDCERNGHHYGPGPGALPAREREALSAEHPDLYGPRELLIEGGRLSLRSTAAAIGFGTPVLPSLPGTEPTGDCEDQTKTGRIDHDDAEDDRSGRVRGGPSRRDHDGLDRRRQDDVPAELGAARRP